MNELLQRLGAMWSDDCRAFIAHWAQLRGDAILPTTETFFDHATGQFAPYLYVVELTDDVALVRFQGTVLDERWAAQLTGKDLHEGMPATLRRRSLSNMRRIVSQPCGYIARNAYATSLGRTVTADLVQLPLAARDGRPPARGVSVADAARRRYGREGIRISHRSADMDRPGRRRAA